MVLYLGPRVLREYSQQIQYSLPCQEIDRQDRDTSGRWRKSPWISGLVPQSLSLGGRLCLFYFFHIPDSFLEPSGSSQNTM